MASNPMTFRAMLRLNYPTIHSILVYMKMSASSIGLKKTTPQVLVVNPYNARLDEPKTVIRLGYIERRNNK